MLTNANMIAGLSAIQIHYEEVCIVKNPFQPVSL